MRSGALAQTPFRLLFLGQAISALGDRLVPVALAFAVLGLTGNATVAELAALQAVYGAAEAFFGPASTAIVPQTVAPGQLQQANALLGLSANLAAVLGPALAGGRAGNLDDAGRSGRSVRGHAAGHGVDAGGQKFHPSAGGRVKFRPDLDDKRTDGF